MRLLYCGIPPSSWCPGSSWFSLWLLVSLGSSCSACGVAPNLRIQWICWEFSAATACAISFLCCFSCTLSSSEVSMHYTLSITVCTCTLCQWASFSSKTDPFLRSHGPDTLACKARPSFDWCGTSLSVSLSLSPLAPNIVAEWEES